MKSIATTQCGNYAHPELILGFDPAGALEADAQWFAQNLERVVAAGSKFKPGQTLQVGWSIAWLVAVPDGALGFEEPDMKSLPVTRQSGLTASLRHLRLQKDTLESVLPAEALSFPSLQQSCLVCTEVTAGQPFFMQRSQSQGDDSGWFVACISSNHDHDKVESLRKTSLYQLVVQTCPGTLPYLAFPATSSILLQEGVPMFFLGEKELPVKKGSYVDAKGRRGDS